jgi:hypothetical protein
MPMISQLPVTGTVSSYDLLLVSQGGSAHAVSVGTLLAQVQPAIIVAEGVLLGRSSLGAGGPDPINVGPGLSLNQGTLQATGFDPTTLPDQSTLSPTDQAVVVNGTVTQLLELSQLRQLFAAGTNVTIDSTGTISATLPATGSTNLSSLTLVTSMSAEDLVSVAKSGQSSAISYSDFLDGISIDMAEAASAASDTDAFWVAQSGTTLLRQTLSEMWNWITAKLPTWDRPVVELSINTTLDPVLHNNAFLICSSPLLLSNPTTAPGSGFSCDIINLSTGLVTFSSSIITPTGSGALGPNQSCRIYGITYSGGTVTITSASNAVTTLVVPGQVTGLAATATTANAISLSWLAPASGGPASVYIVQYRVTGSAPWLTAGQTASANLAVSSLSAATSYDFAVLAENAAGAGSISSVLTVTTSTSVALPSAPTGVSISAITANSATCAWTAGSTSPAGTTFTVQYKAASSSTWSTAVSNSSATSVVLTGLIANTAYQVQVIAADSAGTGPTSSTTSFTTLATAGLVTSIVWNLVPSSGYTHGSGAVGVNAHVAPSTAPIQFGFSQSQTSPPASWTAGIAVNTDLWGAYVPTPATAGTYYAWAEGTDGSMPTVYTTPFTVT